VRSFIVGTAGHIDHGKSALVRALTGTDPDRLKEEKERGITIDIGFAHVALDAEVTASFIDVPGHERFVRNMLAGAHGIDAVALVVAADESVMPQTREHFHICRLLGVARGLVVLTKCDLADAESQALAELEVRELVKGSFLEGAPLLRVSARTGQGLDELRGALRELARSAPLRAVEGLLRLPIDRVFTLKGFGTVVTGTLVSGRLVGGEELVVLPSGRRARVRGLQVHGAAAESVAAGSRAAVNLAGLEVQELARGDVLAHPDTLRPTSILDVEVASLPGERALKQGSRVRVHAASAEVLARVRLLEAGPLGATGLAQLRLERPVVVGRGDRLILRSYSPSVTIAGAVVLDPEATKPRGRDAGRLERLRALRQADVPQAARLMIQAAGANGLDLATLVARVTAPAGLLRAALEGSSEIASFGVPPAVFLSRPALDALAAAGLQALRRFHDENPLKAAMPREELRRRLFARHTDAVFEAVLSELAARGEARLVSDAVALAQHAVRLTPAEQAARAALLEAVQAGGLAGVELPQFAGASGVEPRLAERVSRLLQDEGLLRRVGEGLLVHREHLERLKVDVRRRWPPGSRLDVAGFKELTGLSRKFVIPLLEFLDRERVTRRAGTDRLVLS
jgi:selenocysteine-specific elongation factor